MSNFALFLVSFFGGLVCVLAVLLPMIAISHLDFLRSLDRQYPGRDRTNDWLIFNWQKRLYGSGVRDG